MNYALQQGHIAKHTAKNTARHLTGISVVVMVHVLILFALVTGLTRPHFPVPVVPPTVGLIEPPIKKLIEPVNSIDKPTFKSPDRIFVPAPPIDIASPVPTLFPTNFPSDERFSVPSDNPATMNIGQGEIAKPIDMVSLACPNSRQVQSNINYPAQARRDGLQGDVLMRFVVSAAGSVKDINIVNSTNRAFNSTAMNAVRQFECVSQGRDVAAEVAFSFKMPN